jgi:hypothetical protein
MPANGIPHVPLRLSAELREGGILRRQACERSNGVSTCVTLKCPALVDTDPLSREEEFTMPNPTIRTRWSSSTGWSRWCVLGGIRTSSRRSSSRRRSRFATRLPRPSVMPADDRTA